MSSRIVDAGGKYRLDYLNCQSKEWLVNQVVLQDNKIEHQTELCRVYEKDLSDLEDLIKSCKGKVVDDELVKKVHDILVR